MSGRGRGAALVYRLYTAPRPPGLVLTARRSRVSPVPVVLASAGPGCVGRVYECSCDYVAVLYTYYSNSGRTCVLISDLIATKLRRKVFENYFYFFEILHNHII